MVANILIVEDCNDTNETLQDYLGNAGFNTFSAETAEEARSLVKAHSLDTCLLDLELPDNHDFNLLQEINQLDEDLPIIVISGRTGLSEQILSLELGADDYITKPVDLRGLHARIRAVLRRKQKFEKKLMSMTENISVDESHEIVFLDYHFDRIKKIIHKEDKVLAVLSEVEASTFYVLLKADGHAVSREDILNFRNLASDGSQYRSVDISITRLRNKLSKFMDGSVIETVYGVGYRLNFSSQYFASVE